MSSRARRVAQNTSLVLVGLLVGVAVLVGVYEWQAGRRYEAWRASFDNSGNFGTITVPSKDPVLMWEYKPYGRRPEEPLLETNRFGFRERDLETTEKPPGVLRFAFIGDSVTLGLGVTAEESFVRRFEVLAAQSGAQEVQSLNFGIDGYSTLQVAELLRTRVLEYSPDAVVYGMCLNDFDLDGASGGKTFYFRRPRSFLLYRLRTMWQEYTGAEYHRYHFDRNRDRVFQEILAMQDLLRRRGVGFFVAVLPIFPEAPDRPGSPTYPATEIHRAVGEFLQRAGIPHLDLLETLAEAERTAGHPLSESIWHPVPEGHEVIAEALLPPLMRLAKEPR